MKANHFVHGSTLHRQWIYLSETVQNASYLAKNLSLHCPTEWDYCFAKVCKYYLYRV